MTAADGWTNELTSRISELLTDCEPAATELSEQVNSIARGLTLDEAVVEAAAYARALVLGTVADIADGVPVDPTPKAKLSCSGPLADVDWRQVGEATLVRVATQGQFP